VRAALITGRGQLDLREFPDPTPAPTGVVVDIALCGICGTDIHAYQSGNPYNPAICGHEWTGVVSAVGAEAPGVAEGDRVVVGVPPACGRCDACRLGQTDRCLTTFLVAVGRDELAPPHGGFAPRLAVGANRVVPVDPALTIEQAAQVEPATVAFHAVRRSQPRLGDTAVVQGAGPIGLTTLQWVRAGGAGEVIVVEPDPARASLAQDLGADAVVAPADAAAFVLERTHGLGADIVYECVGRPETVQSAVDLARRGGTMVLIGLAVEQASIEPGTWLVKEITVMSSLAYSHEDFERSMGMIADGRVRLEPMHTSTVGLDDLDACLARLAGGAGADVKVLVDPRAG
jgi:(R,R)-butanediol dehydrogenase/meso-butanediol dehydrogenase/diacetyl reductase